MFDLIEEEQIRPVLPTRPPDIRIEIVNGVKWVRIKNKPRGISVFDRPGIFKGRSWEYYKIPAGIKLPAGLAIVRDKYNPVYQATHYTIAPAYDLPLDHFKLLLNALANQIQRDVA